MLLTGGNIVTAQQVLTDGYVAIVDGRIAAVGSGTVPTAFVTERRIDLGGRTVLPGFVELHHHGGGGATFDDGAQAIAVGLAAHRRHGTTRCLLSLVDAPMEQMLTAIAQAATVAETDPHVLGLHLEGPFLSVARRGVHNPANLLNPSVEVAARLLETARGTVRQVTLAPELPGGIPTIEYLVSCGVHAAIGHSDATYDQAKAGFDAGADMVTHAFNGMRPMHHRDPAIIGAGMAAGALFEVVNDGVHVHPATVAMLDRIAAGRMAFITDAMGAACAGDGDYELCGYPVVVRDGVARLRDGDSIAGSTLTLDVAVRRGVQVLGMSLPDAVNAASLVPAELLGVSDDYGSIAPGRAADLVICDDDLQVLAVLADGQWADERRG